MIVVRRALFLLLSDSDPTQYSALAVGYVLTTGAQLVAAATLAYNYWTQVRSALPQMCGLDRVVAGAQCSMCTALTAAATFLLFMVFPWNMFFGGGLLRNLWKVPGLNC